jgi:hypothetical protein
VTVTVNVWVVPLATVAVVGVTASQLVDAVSTVGVIVTLPAHVPVICSVKVAVLAAGLDPTVEVKAIGETDGAPIVQAGFTVSGTLTAPVPAAAVVPVFTPLIVIVPI